ncbi:efflux RND transporter periplasmic adaptor subunit [Hahella ganghwensis]|uniref:efflux RND transporter periplasmic adaptor subunit n=1 Tax=Hahella ganghwensis TaxID=286420 RepID=UPI0003610603|nr:efflux RND transporter periplasmic adaptor subunit [Hahella ganghwensis]
MSRIKCHSLAAFFLLTLTGFEATAENLQPSQQPAGQEVRTQTITLQPHQRQLEAYGVVEAFQSSMIASRIAAAATELTPSFEPGVHVEKGELLVRLDKTEYQRMLSEALSDLAVARLALQQQQATSDSAREDWYATNTSPPSPLAVQEPQLEAAKARVKSAQAKVRKARSDLQATEVRAPFTGWITQRHISIGDWATTGASLGRLISDDQVRIKLTLAQHQANLLTSVEAMSQIEVSLSPGREDSHTPRWQTHGLALAPVVDNDSRQLHAYTVYRQPFSATPPLRPGTFVSATIALGDFQSLYALPESALSQRNSFFILNQGYLKEVTANIKYQNAGYVYLSLPGYVDNGPELEVVIQDTGQLWDGAPAYSALSSSLAEVNGDQNE